MGRKPKFGGIKAKNANAVERLQSKMDGLRDLRATYEMMPFENRDFESIRKLNVKIKACRCGLRSAGALYGS